MRPKIAIRAIPVNTNASGRQIDLMVLKEAAVVKLVSHCRWALADLEGGYVADYWRKDNIKAQENKKPSKQKAMAGRAQNAPPSHRQSRFFEASKFGLQKLGFRSLICGQASGLSFRRRRRRRRSYRRRRQKSHRC